MDDQNMSSLNHSSSLNQSPTTSAEGMETAASSRPPFHRLGFWASLAVAFAACGTASAQTTYYWRGLTDTVWNGGVDNWSTDKAGTTPASTLPTTTTDVIFAWDGASGGQATTLGQSFSINSLRVEPGTNSISPVTIGPGDDPANSLTIGAGGITSAAGGPAFSISAPVVVGAAQTWSIASGRLLTVSSGVSGTGSIAKADAGTLALTSSNSYSGGTTLGAGIIRIGDNHALGSGTLGVTGGTLEATGASRSIANDVTLNANLGIAAGSQNLTLSGSVVLTGGNRTINNTMTSSTLTLSGPVFLTAAGDSARVHNISGGGHTVLSGPLTNGPGAASAIQKQGTGTLTVSNTFAPGTTFNVFEGQLRLLSGGTVTTGASSNLNIGTSSGLNAFVSVAAGSSITAANVQLGSAAAGGTGNGSLVINGGTVRGNASSSGLTIGANAAVDGYGGLFLLSGSASAPWVTMGSTSTSGSSSGVIRVDGGTLADEGILITRNANFEVTITGGKIDRSASTGNLGLGFQNSGTGALNVVGGLIDNTGRDVAVRGSLGTPEASINLNAGRLITNSMTTGAGGTGWLNFNGGTLEPGSTGGTLVATSMTAAYVNGPFGTFAGGAVIDTNGKDTTIAEPMLAPTGSGLSGLTLAAAGTGYIGSPVVRITGGGGTGATGYATVDLNPDSATFGELTGVVLTNPGVGYTSAPTIALIGGGGSGASVTPGSLAANTSGGLRKLGAGTLTLSAANTYTGTTAIEAGTLALGAAGTFDSSSRIIVGTAGSSGAVLDLTAKTDSFAFLAGQTVGGIGTINIGSGKTVSSAGIWAPGNSIGSNTVTGNLTLTGTSQFELGTPGTSTSAPGTSDFTAVSGTLTLGGALQLLDNAGADGNGSAGGGVYRLFTYGTEVSGSYASVTAPATTRTSLANITYEGAGTGSGQGVFLSLYNLASATSAQTVNIGNVHVGATATQAVTLTNTAPANATYTETLGTDGFTSTTSGFTATGEVSGIAGQGSDSGTLVVGFTTGSAGARSGSTVLGLTSSEVNSSGLGTVSVGSQTITITGTVWNLAGATVASGTTVNFGTVLKNTPLSQSLSIANTAPDDGFSEGLSAALGATTGGASGTGSWSLLAAGGTSTAFSVSLGSGSAGAASGTQVLNFTSDGDGTSGLGLTTIGSETVSLEATILDPALASFAADSTALSLLLDFGEVEQNSVVSPLEFSLFNLTQTAGFTADLALVEIGQTAPSGPLETSLAVFDSLVAGGSDLFAATFSTAALGSFTNVYTLTFKSSNDGTVYLDDTPQTLTLTMTGVVVPEPGALGIALAGLAGLAWHVRRRRVR
jgi:fibronectin-binding autotransporter adhesin